MKQQEEAEKAEDVHLKVQHAGASMSWNCLLTFKCQGDAGGAWQDGWDTEQVVGPHTASRPLL